MRYLLIAPQDEALMWSVEKRITLGFTVDRLVLSYCEGPQPPKGATGMIVEGERGEIIWWAIESGAPLEALRLLSKEANTDSPATGTEATA